MSNEICHPINIISSSFFLFFIWKFNLQVLKKSDLRLTKLSSTNRRHVCNVCTSFGRNPRLFRWVPNTWDSIWYGRCQTECLREVRDMDQRARTRDRANKSLLHRLDTALVLERLLCYRLCSLYKLFHNLLLDTTLVSYPLLYLQNNNLNFSHLQKTYNFFSLKLPRLQISFYFLILINVEKVLFAWFLINYTNWSLYSKLSWKKNQLKVIKSILKDIKNVHFEEAKLVWQ